jgi:hypothetical protein
MQKQGSKSTMMKSQVLPPDFLQHQIFPLQDPLGHAVQNHLMVRKSWFKDFLQQRFFPCRTHLVAINNHMQQYRSSPRDLHRPPRSMPQAAVVDPATLAVLESRINSQQSMIEQQVRTIRRLESQLQQLESLMRKNL